MERFKKGQAGRPWGFVYLQKPGAAVWLVTAPNCPPVVVRAESRTAAAAAAADALCVPPARLEALCSAQEVRG